MTHFADLLYQGASVTGITTDDNGGFGFGPLTGVYLYTITPVALGTALVAALQTLGAAGNFTLTAGTGTTSGTLPDGTTGIILDVPRNVTITSTGNLASVNFTVTGFDTYNQLQTATLTGLNNNTIATAIAFKSIKSIAADAAVGTNTSAGIGDVFGLPVRVTDAGQLVRVAWAGAVADDSATFVAGAATANADDRGTIDPSSASNGTRVLSVGIALTAAQVRSGSRVDLLGY